MCSISGRLAVGPIHLLKVGRSAAIHCLLSGQGRARRREKARDFPGLRHFDCRRN
jgi:hypothetical protein